MAYFHHPPEQHYLGKTKLFNQWQFYLREVTKMNKHILIAMDHENRSKEELKKNLDAAHEAAVAVRAA
ncbi:MAG: hypothetical protein HRU26_02320, partial [Psychroserpens sp.]|nr:hypothetical protein [Psychroserpens sp.]